MTDNPENLIPFCVLTFFCLNKSGYFFQCPFFLLRVTEKSMKPISIFVLMGFSISKTKQDNSEKRKREMFLLQTIKKVKRKNRK